MSPGARQVAGVTGAVLAILALALTASAQGTVTGAVSVTVGVVDGTGVGVADVDVTLEVHDGGQEVGRFQARSDSDGMCRWVDVPAGAGVHARAIAAFADTSYSSDVTTLSPGTDAQLEVRVFPVTSDVNPLHTEMFHLIVHASVPGAYQVAQVMQVRNLGEQAWLGAVDADGGPEAGIVIPFPAGARNVTPIPPPEGGLDPALTEIHEDHVLDLRPMPPGVRQVAISYELVAGRDGVDVSFPVGYPTQSVSLLVGGPEAVDLNVQTDVLQERPVESIGGESFSSWSAEALGASALVSFTLTTGGVSSISPEMWAALCVIAGLLLPVVATLLGAGGSAHVEHMRDDLVYDVAELDSSHAAGEIEDADYFARRGRALEILETLDALAADAEDDA